MSREQELTDLEDLRNNQIWETVEGTEIAIEDSASARMKLKLQGDMNQDGDPTFDEPIDVETVTGDVKVIVSNGEDETQEISLSLGDIELYGNDTWGRDYLYKKADKWYKHCLWNKWIFDGTETIVLNSAWNSSYPDICHCYIIRSKFGNTSYKSASNNNVNMVKNNCIITGSQAKRTFDAEYSYLESSTGYYVFFISADRLEGYSVNGVKAFLASLYEAGNPMIIYFLRNEAADEEITDETLIKQLNELLNLRTYKTTTNVSTETENLNPLLNLTYMVDTKTYIDSKLETEE